MQEITFRAMGCQIRALIDADGIDAMHHLERVSCWFAGWEHLLSRFLRESELSRLNRRAGCLTPVSPTLWEVLGVALMAARESDGLVSPTLLPALEAAGYDRSFAALVADERPMAANAPDSGLWRLIQRRPRRRSVRMPPQARLDLGGTAKGWAAGLATRRLATVAPALVDAGGDIAVSGPRVDGTPWSVTVGTADDDAPDLDLIRLYGGGIATSGIDYRRWQRGGDWRHHIIDPRTGRPAESNVVMASVIGASVLKAEVGAKVALILGSREGLAWIEARPALAALLYLNDGRIVTSQRWESFR